MTHPYYDSEKRIKSHERSITILLICSIILILSIIFIPVIIKWEDSQIDYEDGFIDYEVVIWNDHDVMLYNTNDVTDSLHLRLENSSNLFGEQMIQIHK